MEYFVTLPENLQIVCRFCLSQNGAILALEEEQTQNILSNINLEVEITDQLPKKICRVCKASLINFFNFKTMVNTNAKILKAVVGKPQISLVECTDNPNFIELDANLNMSNEVIAEEEETVMKNECVSSSNVIDEPTIISNENNDCGEDNVTLDDKVVVLDDDDDDDMEDDLNSDLTSNYSDEDDEEYDEEDETDEIENMEVEDDYFISDKQQCQFCLVFKSEDKKKFEDHIFKCERVMRNIVEFDREGHKVYQCLLCDFNQNQKNVLKRHVASKNCRKSLVNNILMQDEDVMKNVLTKDLKYKCLICFEEFDTQIKIVNHLNNVSCVDPPKTCEFKEKVELKKCSTCRAHFKSQNELDLHQFRCNRVVKHILFDENLCRYICGLCGYKKELKSKIKIHVGNKICRQAIFKKIDNKEVGKLVQLKNCKVSYTCPLCNGSFTNLHQLKVHIVGVNCLNFKPDEKEKNVCQYCSSMVDKCMFDQHKYRCSRVSKIIEQTSPLSYKCTLCDFTTNNVGAVKRHVGLTTCRRSIMQKIQAKEIEMQEKTTMNFDEGRIFVCPLCGQTSDTQTKLLNHIKHKNCLDLDADEPDEETSESPKRCQICDAVTFFDLEKLEIHEVKCALVYRHLQTVGNNFKCAVCWYISPRRASVKNHVGNALCRKEFARKLKDGDEQTLKSVCRGDSFECMLCEQVFTLKEELCNHLMEKSCLWPNETMQHLNISNNNVENDVIIKISCKYCSDAFELDSKHFKLCEIRSRSMYRLNNSHKHHCGLCNTSVNNDNVNEHFMNSYCRKKLLQNIRSGEIKYLLDFLRKDDQNFQCSICLENFSEPADVIKHLNTLECMDFEYFEQLDYKKITCACCPLTFTDQENHKKHQDACYNVSRNIEEVLKNNLYKCRLCEYSSKYRFNIKLHIGNEICRETFLGRDMSIFSEITKKFNDFFECPFCSLLFVRDDLLVEHIRNFECQVEKCNIDDLPLNLQVNYYSDLDDNLNDLKDCANNTFCHLCDTELESNLLFSLHYFEHIVLKQFLEKNVNIHFCYICGFIQETEDFTNHFIEKHPGYMVKQIQCSKCDEEVNDCELVFHMFRNHDVSIIDEKSSCALCGLKFESNEFEDEHFCSHLTQNLQCIPCKSKFATIHSLSHHKNLIHSEEYPVSCVYCTKPFKTKNSLDDHILSQHVSPLLCNRNATCEQCGKVLASKSSLRIHVDYVHGAAKQHVCDTCGYSTSAKNDYNKHMLTHEKLKPQKCSFQGCGKEFTTHSLLKVHMQSHLRQFKCAICTKVFPRLFALKKHLKVVHHAQKLYECKKCMIHFKTDKGYKQHMKKH